MEWYAREVELMKARSSLIRAHRARRALLSRKEYK
jgi:hypothetical protein